MSFGKTGDYDLRMSITNANVLMLNRTLVFGREGNLLFEPKNYGLLKRIFDEVQVRDRHSLSIKEDR